MDMSFLCLIKSFFFCYDAYGLIHKNECSKWDPRPNKYMFAGYGDGVKGNRLWDSTTQKNHH